MAKVYDEIPEASDLVKDINRSIMDEVLAPIAEKIRENDELGLTQTEYCIQFIVQYTMRLLKP